MAAASPVQQRNRRHTTFTTRIHEMTNPRKKRIPVQVDERKRYRYQEPPEPPPMDEVLLFLLLMIVICTWLGYVAYVWLSTAGNGGL